MIFIFVFLVADNFRLFLSDISCFLSFKNLNQIFIKKSIIFFLFGWLMFLLSCNKQHETARNVESNVHYKYVQEKRLNLPGYLQNHYDTIFSYYASQISNDLQLDTISSFNCLSCQYTLEEKIDLSEGYWDYFKSDTCRISSYYRHLTDNAGQGGVVIHGDMPFVAPLASLLLANFRLYV